MNRGWLMVIVAAAVLIGLLSSLDFLFSRGAAKAADEFLTLLAQGRTADAYASATTVFRGEKDAGSFVRLVKRYGLKDYVAADWEPRLGSGQVTLNGEVTKRDGSKTRLVMKLVKEGDKWKVRSLDGPPPKPRRYQHWASIRASWRDRLPPQTLPPIPAEADLQRLAQSTLRDIVQAIETKDFQAFHNNCSRLWKEEVAPRSVQRAFRPFLEGRVDLSGVKTVALKLDRPASLGKDGTLRLSGHVPIAPDWLEFELRYIQEPPDWRLCGLWLATREPGEEEAEPDRLEP